MRQTLNIIGSRLDLNVHHASEPYAFRGFSLSMSQEIINFATSKIFKYYVAVEICEDFCRFYFIIDSKKVIKTFGYM